MAGESDAATPLPRPLTGMLPSGVIPASQPPAPRGLQAATPWGMDTSELPGLILATRRSDTAGRGALDKDFARGKVVRLRPGRYVRSDAWRDLDPTARFVLAAAALASRSPTTVFCGEASLVLRGFSTVISPRHIDVCTGPGGRSGPSKQTFASDERGRPGPAHRPPPMPRYHRHVTPPAAESVNGFLVVPTAIGLAESLAVLPGGRALALADSVQRGMPRLPLAKWADLQVEIDRLLYPAWQRRSTLLAALSRAGAESPGESVSRAIMLGYGFPEPALQHPHFVGGKLIAYTDFWWDLLGVVGEFDGMSKYLNPAFTGPGGSSGAVMSERRRELELRAEVNQVLRWGWQQLQQPQLLRGLLVRAGLPLGEPLPELLR